MQTITCNANVFGKQLCDTIHSINQNFQALGETMNRIEAEITALRTQNQASEARIQQLLAEGNNVFTELQNLKAQGLTADSRYAELTEDLKNRNAEIVALQQSIANNQVVVQNLETQLANWKGLESVITVVDSNLGQIRQSGERILNTAPTIGIDASQASVPLTFMTRDQLGNVLATYDQQPEQIKSMISIMDSTTLTRILTQDRNAMSNAMTQKYDKELWDPLARSDLLDAMQQGLL